MEYLFGFPPSQSSNPQSSNPRTQQQDYLFGFPPSQSSNPLASNPRPQQHRLYLSDYESGQSSNPQHRHHHFGYYRGFGSHRNTYQIPPRMQNPEDDADLANPVQYRFEGEEPQPYIDGQPIQSLASRRQAFSVPSGYGPIYRYAGQPGQHGWFMNNLIFLIFKKMLKLPA
ncbi:unnamed protein product [Meloidogyne enterolobii]|uniref:Uncharacterized protein n=1 Tax=Meloidogyne enterolobii TaxID=390850 RepID=A0ACB0YEA1_MELEN